MFIYCISFLYTILFFRLVNGPPNIFWFGGFYFPQGFLTGTQQNHSRKYQLAIDSLNFSFTILETADVADIPPDMGKTLDGVLCTGMYFDGARWDFDEKYVCDPRPGTPDLFYSMLDCFYF